MSSAARRPPFDDQFRRRFIELHKDNLFHVSCEHLTRGCTFNRDRSIRDRSARDLRLTWPCPLVAPDWINGCTVERKARIPLKVCKFSRARHRTERQPAVYELAFDSRDSRRTVGPQCRNRLVTSRCEQLLDSVRHFWFIGFEVTPGGHGTDDNRVGRSG